MQRVSCVPRRPLLLPLLPLLRLPRSYSRSYSTVNQDSKNGHPPLQNHPHPHPQPQPQPTAQARSSPPSSPPPTVETFSERSRPHTYHFRPQPQQAHHRDRELPPLKVSLTSPSPPRSLIANMQGPFHYLSSLRVRPTTRMHIHTSPSRAPSPFSSSSHRVASHTNVEPMAPHPPLQRPRHQRMGSLHGIHDEPGTSLEFRHATYHGDS